MGAGYHGGFGNTHGAVSAAIVDVHLVGNGSGKELEDAAKRIPHLKGFTDVAVHGTPDHIAFITLKNGKETVINLDHRRLAKFIKRNSGYEGGNIRLISCKTGSPTGSFAQNLANKLGVTVRAPSDTLFIFPNGKMVIGPNMFTNSGKWIDFHPYNRKEK